MKLLLDTCVLVWLCAEPRRLSRAAHTALKTEGTSWQVSDVSALELSLKWSRGLIQLPGTPRVWVEEQIKTWRLAVIPVQREDMYAAAELERIHGDPFDRLLIAQAMRRGMTILTPDPHMRKYPVATQW